MFNQQWCKSLLSIGGDNLHFYPNFALFSTLVGMNLDQVKSRSKKKKGLHQKWNTFFPEFKYRPALRCTLESNYWRDADEDHTQTVRGYTVKLLGGIYPPRVSTPLCLTASSFVAG